MISVHKYARFIRFRYLLFQKSSLWTSVFETPHVRCLLYRLLLFVCYPSCQRQFLRSLLALPLVDRPSADYDLL